MRIAPLRRALPASPHPVPSERRHTAAYSVRLANCRQTTRTLLLLASRASTRRLLASDGGRASQTSFVLPPDRALT
eukprot:scaffold3051_cov112-Isochrysis_galbana.AAC.5